MTELATRDYLVCAQCHSRTCVWHWDPKKVSSLALMREDMSTHDLTLDYALDDDEAMQNKFSFKRPTNYGESLL